MIFFYGRKALKALLFLISFFLQLFFGELLYADDSIRVSNKYYCDFLASSSIAKNSLLVYPQLFIKYQPNSDRMVRDVDGNEVSVDGGSEVGLNYDFVGLYRASLNHKYSRLECERHKIHLSLNLLLQERRFIGRYKPMLAQQARLESIFQLALERLNRFQLSVESRDISWGEIVSFELMLDRLRERLEAIRTEVEQMQVIGVGGLSSIHDVGKYLQAEDRVYKVLSDIDESQAWSFGVNLSQELADGARADDALKFKLTASYNLGSFSQKQYNERALSSRRKWVESDPLDASSKLNQLFDYMSKLIVFLSDRRKYLAVRYDLVKKRLDGLAKGGVSANSVLYSELWLTAELLENDILFVDAYRSQLEELAAAQEKK